MTIKNFFYILKVMHFNIWRIVRIMSDLSQRNIELYNELERLKQTAAFYQNQGNEWRNQSKEQLKVIDNLHKKLEEYAKSPNPPTIWTIPQ